MRFQNQHLGPPGALRSIKARKLAGDFPPTTSREAGQKIPTTLAWGDWIVSRSPGEQNAGSPADYYSALHPTPIADAVPKFDIARECQFEGGPKQSQERCAADESQARDQVQ